MWHSSRPEYLIVKMYSPSGITLKAQVLALTSGGLVGDSWRWYIPGVRSGM